jgi:hypothetical protein
MDVDQSVTEHRLPCRLGCAQVSSDERRIACALGWHANGPRKGDSCEQSHRITCAF